VNPIRVLVADDSAFARDVIRELLNDDPRIVIAGEAANGADALEQTMSLKPDIITMDIQMPVMDGFEAIKQIMACAPTPILVLTSLQDSDLAYKAVAFGALEVMEKPKLTLTAKNQLISKILFLSKVKVIRHLKDHVQILNTLQTFSGMDKIIARKAQQTVKSCISGPPQAIIAIASSTGGPKALAVILSQIPANFPAAILIAQHIGAGFSSGLATWLGNISPLIVTIASHKEPVCASHVYIPPDNHHMEISKSGEILLSPKNEKTVYTPSADLLLSSVASFVKERAIGVVLTGMGRDGSSGIAAIYNGGGATIAQNEQSSIIFGMPKAAIETGCINKIVALEDIPSILQSLVRAQAKGNS